MSGDSADLLCLQLMDLRLFKVSEAHYLIFICTLYRLGVERNVTFALLITERKDLRAESLWISRLARLEHSGFLFDFWNREWKEKNSVWGEEGALRQSVALPRLCRTRYFARLMAHSLPQYCGAPWALESH